MTRGFAPELIREDPLAHAYDELIAALETAGYVRDEDLFVVTYDWRAPVAPEDGSLDGVISQDRQFHHARSSERRSAKAWNPWHDNFSVDFAFQYVLSELLQNAYRKVVDQNAIIQGPGASADITLQSILDDEGNPDPKKFLQQYVPTIRNLLPTYRFLDAGAGPDFINDRLEVRNGILLDLNSGLDTASPSGDLSAFAARVQASAVYGTSEDTIVQMVEHTGPANASPIPFLNGTIASLDGSFPNFARIPGKDEVWYQEQTLANFGDGTVPLNSLRSRFLGDPRVTLHEFAASASHLGLAANTEALRTMVRTLGYELPSSWPTVLPSALRDWLEKATRTLRSYANQAAGIPTIVSVMLDPVEGLLVDAQGRRLGMSSGSVAVAEIPNSLYLGDQNGLGWVIGEVAGPLEIQLTGLDADYLVEVSGVSETEALGRHAAGFLSQGQTTDLDVQILVPNTTPQVDVVSPVDGTTFAQGNTIAFAGTATDNEDGELTGSLVWTSSIDGMVGAGGSFATTLSVGEHTITASVVDSGGLSAAASVTVTVEALAYRNPDNRYDVSASDGVDLHDAVLVVRFLVTNGAVPPFGTTPPYPDVAAPDNLVNLQDVRALLRYLATTGVCKPSVSQTCSSRHSARPAQARRSVVTLRHLPLATRLC